MGDENMTFCKDICCHYGKNRNYSIEEWEIYLEDSCFYYKFKLIWTWIYLMFCCFHCHIFGICCQRKEAKKKMNRLFLASEKIMTKKFNEVDLEVRGSPKASSNSTEDVQQE